MFLIGWVGVSTSLDPYEFLSFMFRGSDSACTSNGYNLTCYRDDVVDILLELANTNPDFAIREDLYVAVQRIAVGQDYAILPLYHESLIRGVNKRVKDYTVSSTEMIPFPLCTPLCNVWVSD
jgi:ABC-type transport system substrate-binding protein